MSARALFIAVLYLIGISVLAAFRDWPFTNVVLVWLVVILAYVIDIHDRTPSKKD